MKWIVFVLAALATYPIGALWLRDRPHVQRWLVSALGFLPFVDLDPVTINFISHETYRGASRGFEVTLVDLIALTLAFALPRSKFVMPYRFVRWLYFAAAALTIFWAQVPLYAAFSTWKILRAYFLMGVIVRACEQEHGPWLLRGMAAGVVYAFGIALKQRYLEGYYRVQGPFPHPNTLGMAVNFVMPVAFSLLLAGQGGWLAVACCLAAAAAVIMTLSRGALAMTVGAVGMSMAGSLIRGVTRRKVWVTLSAGLLGAALLAYSADSIIERIENAPKGSEEAREQFNRAASMMLDDHPLGVGINNFSFTMDKRGYADEIGLHDMDRGAIAHHIYWLTLAEMGYFGLFAYLLTLLMPWWTAAKTAWRARGDIRGDVAVGLVAGLTVTYVQGIAEWVARQTPMMYLFWMAAGWIAVLARQTGADNPRAR